MSSYDIPTSPPPSVTSSLVITPEDDPSVKATKTRAEAQIKGAYIGANVKWCNMLVADMRAVGSD